jgi:exopolysaccharide production protein ExoZ
MATSARGFGEASGPARFLLRRVIRIAPHYWLLTALVIAGAALAPALMNVPLGGLWLPLASVLFIAALRPNGEIRPALGQGWTLNYEMFFYACFALAMLLPRRAAFVALTLGLSALVWLGRDLTPADPILFTWTDGLLIEFLFGLWIGAARLGGLRAPPVLAAALTIAGVALAIWMDPTKGRAPLPGFVLSGVPAALIVTAARASRAGRGRCCAPPICSATRPIASISSIPSSSASDAKSGCGLSATLCRPSPSSPPPSRRACSSASRSIWRSSAR